MQPVGLDEGGHAGKLSVLGLHHTHIELLSRALVPGH
jgi:hypothetical protein